MEIIIKAISKIIKPMEKGYYIKMEFVIRDILLIIIWKGKEYKRL
jgi:hypothetical protein